MSSVREIQIRVGNEASRLHMYNSDPEDIEQMEEDLLRMAKGVTGDTLCLTDNTGATITLDILFLPEEFVKSLEPFSIDVIRRNQPTDINSGNI